MKVRKNYRLDKNCIQYVQEYGKKNSINETDALEKIIEEHRQGYLFSDEAFIKKVTVSLAEEFSKTFTRIRLGVNNADRNSQIIIELLNTMIFNSDNTSTFIPTNKTEMYPVTMARKTVKERIEHFRVAQLEREQLKEKKEE